MLTRLLLTLINLFFPPLAVCLLTGPYTDTLISCILFIAGVIPSHIHGFYISCTYFHRKKKVKKGRYPGGPKTGIFDKRVWRGGASWERWEELRVKGKRDKGADEFERDEGVRDGGRGRDEVIYRGEGRSEMSEGLDRRRSILGEVNGRY